jgi:hypothetical protein
MIDTIGTSNDVQVSSVQNNPKRFQPQYTGTLSACENCQNEPIYYDADNIGYCIFCVEAEDID